MKAYAKNLAVKVDALTLRERGMVFAAAVLGSAAIWQLAFMQPVVQRRTALLGEIQAVQQQIDAADQALAAQVSEIPGAGEAGRTLAARLEAVLSRSVAVEADLAARAGQLIDPARMPRVLEDVLSRQGGLELVQMHNRGAEPLLGGAQDGATLYRHVLELEVEGTYLACLDYLRDLETLPWRMYWQAIDIEAIEYPRNRIRIEVSTLSFDEDWIGV